MNEVQRAAIQAASDRRRSLTEQELKDQEMILIRTTHLLMCTPIELVDRETQQHRWHRDKAFVLGSDECHCLTRPMVVLGPDHFLGKES